MKAKNDAAEKWASHWLDGVANGKSKMSQRKLSSVEKQGGGIRIVKKLAAERGVHLLRLTDDHGNELVAASLHPFKVLC